MKQVNCETDPAKAKVLWEAFSPNETIYDLWEFRACFWQAKPLPLRFYALYEKDELVVLLPLQDNQAEGYLEFLADDFMESNRLFCRPGHEAQALGLVKEIKRTLRLYDVVFKDAPPRPWEREDYSYYADLEGLLSFDDYLRRYFPDRRRRQNFRQTFSRLEKQRRLEVAYDNFVDLDKLMQLNQKQFGAESYLASPAERQAFQNVLKLPLEKCFITLKIDGQPAAYSLAVIYNSVYYYLIAGADRSLEPDAFKYLTKLNIELALKKKARIFKAGLGDCGWKNFWHFKQREEYKLDLDV